MKARFDLDESVQAVEHHYISASDSGILFDVSGLRISPAVPIDNEILSRASQPLKVKTLLAEFNDIDPSRGSTRIQYLLESGMLRIAESDAIVAPRAEPSNYITFMINVAQRCNLACRYCYVNLGHFDYPEVPIPRMPLDRAQNLVEDIYRHFPGMSTYGYHFYGGEPLLNFNAIRIIVEQAEAKARSTRTSADFHITTNGTLVTEDIARFMDEHRFTVFFSFDSDQPTHDSARPYKNGSGSFADVTTNLERLRGRKGIHLILSSVISGNNCLSTAIEKLAAQGAHQCKAERAHVDDNDLSAVVGNEEQIYLRDIQGLADHYVSHIEEGKKPLDYRLASKILQLLVGKRRDFFCPAGEQMYGVAANGELYPCSLHVGRPGSLLGNLSDGVSTNATRRFRERFSASEQSDCRTCWNRTLCGGGCSAMIDRFGHEKCDILRAESEAAIRVFHHFSSKDPLQLVTLVSPKIAKWMNGEITDPEELLPSEPSAALERCNLS